MTSGVSPVGGGYGGVYPQDAYYGTVADGMDAPYADGAPYDVGSVGGVNSGGNPYALSSDVYSGSNPYGLRAGGSPQGGHGTTSFGGALVKSAIGFGVGATFGFVKDTLHGMTHDEKTGEFSLGKTLWSAVKIGLGAAAIWATGGLAAIPLGLYGLYKFGGNAVQSGGQWLSAMSNGQYDHAVAASYELGKSATGIGLSFTALRAGVNAASTVAGETAGSAGVFGTIRAGAGQMISRSYWSNMGNQVVQNAGGAFSGTRALFARGAAAGEGAAVEGAAVEGAAVEGAAVEGAVADAGAVAPGTVAPGVVPPAGLVSRVTGPAQPYINAIRENGLGNTVRTVGGETANFLYGQRYAFLRSGQRVPSAVIASTEQSDDPYLNVMNPFREYFNPNNYRYHGVPGEQEYASRYGGIPPYMASGGAGMGGMVDPYGGV